MKRAVIIIGPGFEDTEFAYPFYRLQEAGFKVDVVTSNNQEIKGKHGLPAQPTLQSKDLKPESFDLVVIPGGHEGPDRVRQVKEVLGFVKAMNDLKKPISSVCHGPWVLISAGIVKGKKATCYQGCKDDLINAGAHYLDEPVVTDGHLVTAQHFKYNADWMKATLKLFEK